MQANVRDGRHVPWEEEAWQRNRGQQPRERRSQASEEYARQRDRDQRSENDAFRNETIIVIAAVLHKHEARLLNHYIFLCQQLRESFNNNFINSSFEFPNPVDTALRLRGHIFHETSTSLREIF